jgi:hypothetical protein
LSCPIESLNPIHNRSKTKAIKQAKMQITLNLNPDMTIDKAIEIALQAYLKQQKRLKIVSLFGTIDYDPDYDYK